MSPNFFLCGPWPCSSPPKGAPGLGSTRWSRARHPVWSRRSPVRVAPLPLMLMLMLVLGLHPAPGRRGGGVRQRRQAPRGGKGRGRGGRGPSRGSPRPFEHTSPRRTMARRRRRGLHVLKPAALLSRHSSWLAEGRGVCPLLPLPLPLSLVWSRGEARARARSRADAYAPAPLHYCDLLTQV